MLCRRVREIFQYILGIIYLSWEIPGSLFLSSYVSVSRSDARKGQKTCRCAYMVWVVFSVEVNTMHINHRRKNKRRTCKGCQGSPAQRRSIKKQLSKQFRKLSRLMALSEIPPFPKKTLLWELF